MGCFPVHLPFKKGTTQQVAEIGSRLADLIGVGSHHVNGPLRIHENQSLKCLPKTKTRR